MPWRRRREGEVYVYSFFNLGAMWEGSAALKLQLAQNKLLKFERTKSTLIDTKLEEFKMDEHLDEGNSQWILSVENFGLAFRHNR
jgi:hypothetical protein